MKNKERMTWEDVCHFIAQGVINIDCGTTEIQKDSRIHKAMAAFCEYMTEYDVQLRPKSL